MSSQGTWECGVVVVWNLCAVMYAKVAIHFAHCI